MPLRPLAIVVFAVMLVAVAWISLLGLSFQRWIEAQLGLGDLSLHFLGFAAVTFVGIALWKPAARMVALMILIAGSIEGLQLIAPDRVGSLVDFGMSTTGIAAAWVIGAIIHRVRSSNSRAAQRRHRGKSRTP